MEVCVEGRGDREGEEIDLSRYGRSHQSGCGAEKGLRDQGHGHRPVRAALQWSRAEMKAAASGGWGLGRKWM